MSTFRSIIIGLMAILVALSTGCGDSGTQSCQIQAGDNLLANGSFERDGVPTLEGWAITSSMASLVQEPAPGGGDYSLRLVSEGHNPPSIAITNTSRACEGGTYRLTAYVRSDGGLGGGTVGLFVGQRMQLSGKQASSSDTIWTYVSLVDTIYPGPQDSVWVWLSSFHVPGPAWGAGLFDLVVLERLSE